MEELRAELQLAPGDETRELAGVLEAIELGVCEAERRAVALEQLEPTARKIRGAARGRANSRRVTAGVLGCRGGAGATRS